jgi:regulator of sigma E protease
MKKGDIFLAVNDVKVKYYDEFKTQVLLNRGKAVNFTLLRGSDTVRTSCKVSSDGIVGFIPDEIEETKYVDQDFSIFSSLSAGISEGMEQLVMQAKQFVVIFTVKDAHKQVGGFYTMVQQMNSEWDWQAFWMFTAFLSLALAFMNFLPIPMLDGGYIMFILFEMVTGKKVSDKVIYYANNVGLVIVMGLMVYANTDWLRN